MVELEKETGNEILMKCGHSANALDADGQPCCAICAGLHPGAYVIEDKPPELTGRVAQCTTCNNKRVSSYGLAFFKYNKDGVIDRFYCGCRGWD